MADPPVEGRPPTGTQGSTGPPPAKNVDSLTLPRTRRQPHQRDETTTITRPSAESAGTGSNNGRTTLIEATKSELFEVKHDQNVLRAQNEKLHEEVRALRSQIDALAATPPTRSWAAVAANDGNPSPQPNSQRPDKDQNCVRISTQRSFVDPRDNDNSDGNTFGRYLPTESANGYIRTALSSAPSTQDAQVAGVGTTKTGYVIRFKNQESANAARSNPEWLHELGNNTRLVKPRFGIVVHRTPTEFYDLENSNAHAIERIMADNDMADRGFGIEDVAWLKKKDKALSNFASLGIWFDSAEGADWVLSNGFLAGQRYIGSVERCEIKRKRCFRCNRFGHLAWSCKETPRCGHCAGQHERQRCPPGVRARCLDCSGEHPTGDLQCLTPATSNPAQC
ncbi:uncharacterized protein N7529_007063 [Penicillium soppii]|uniref:uncharacterized protein n=1 Tax=Penicillium soppii TaxID=69789 RepID=UPI002548AF0D|nr:uncharacterized protein N7529_007063 [Penicillium soppii]KAJ5865147.1 hypothetical protein N7529_007063 [Penicillium soppii]